MPMRIPPFTWLSHVSSVSISTSANCTPPAPEEERPSCHWPLTLRGVTPSFLQAPAHFSPRASSTPDCFCNSARALVQTSKIAGATEAVVVLPPLPPEGEKLVSPTLTVICSGLNPSRSAAIKAMTVFEPMPRSYVQQ